MDAQRIKVIICRVGQEPVVETIDHGLDAMQKIVGGYVECVPLAGSSFGHGIDLWCDEEFLFKRYEPNRQIFSPRRNHLVVHGDFFIAAHDGEGETIGLADDEIEHWLVAAKAWPEAVWA